MTAALVERIARLLHEETRAWAEQHNYPLDYVSWKRWDNLDPKRQEMYRAVVRKLLLKLGH